MRQRSPMTPIRVAVDASFVQGTSVGVETRVMGLAQGFADISLGDVSLTFVTYMGLNEWIRPYLHSSLSLVEVSPRGRVRRMLHKGRIWAVRPHGRSFSVLPGRDRTISSLGTDI